MNVNDFRLISDLLFEREQVRRRKNNEGLPTQSVGRFERIFKTESCRLALRNLLQSIGEEQTKRLDSEALWTRTEAVKKAKITYGT
jgi:hypothetical protein